MVVLSLCSGHVYLHIALFYIPGVIKAENIILSDVDARMLNNITKVIHDHFWM